MKNPFTTRQRGMTLPMLALFIVTLFVVASLAIDLGVLSTGRTSAQHAADAAALAGAYTFLSPTAIQPDAAINAAIAMAKENKVLGQAVAITATEVTVDIPNRRVTVTVPRTGGNGLTTYFARVIGVNSVDVVTTATAEAGLLASGSRCIKPIFLPNTILSALPVADACNQGQKIFGPDGKYSSWFLANSSSLYGAPMSVRPTSPGGALVPSQFYTLDFGSGANTYRCTFGGCLSDCGVDLTKVNCGLPLSVETGNMVGPTNQGLELLIGNPADTWGGIDSTTGEYTFYLGGDKASPVSSSRSMAVVPVWDDCSQTIVAGKQGQTVKVAGFLGMFFEGMSGDTVKARLLNASECGVTGGAGTGPGGTSPSGTGPMGVPVRLVQTPTS